MDDAGIYSLGSANDRAGSSGPETSLGGCIDAGNFVYVSNDMTKFALSLGSEPVFVGTAADIDGNDALELFKSGAVIDSFGIVGVDGTGEPWDYSTRWAYRKDKTGPNRSVFSPQQWTWGSGTAGALGKNTSQLQRTGSAHLASFPAKTFRAPVSSPAEACPVLAGAAAAQEQGAVPVLYIVVVAALASALCLALWTVCKVLSRRARGNQSDSHGNSPKSARHFCPDRPATVGRPVEGDPCPKSPRESARGPSPPYSDMSRVEWEGQIWQDQRTSV